MKRLRKGKIVVTRWFTPGYPVGLPAEAMVEVVARSGERYQVKSSHGSLYWLDREAFRVFGEEA